jgi:antitoxin component YwqK of YwqJK toxin-antitoxin module
MKITLILALLTPLSLYGCNSNELDFRNTEVSNGLIYKKQEDRPFSGALTNLPENTIHLTDGFNSFLLNYNQAMEKSSANENKLIGRYLICNSEIKNGYLSGLTSCYTPNTTVKRYTVQYSSGKLNGEAKIYAPNGASVLATADFKNDLIDGEVKVYGPHTGKLIGEYHSTNGKADGEQCSWSEATGKMTYNAKTKDGMYIDSLRIWSNDGVLTAEVPFLNGLKNGLTKTWFASGKPLTVVMMKDGYRDGTSSTWDEQGNLTSSGTYKREIWYPDVIPNDQALPPTLSSNDACVTQWIDASHKQNGEDENITSEQLEEWAQWCSGGRRPK